MWHLLLGTGKSWWSDDASDDKWSYANMWWSPVAQYECDTSKNPPKCPSAPRLSADEEDSSQSPQEL